jgi:hypothetical protein
VQQRAETLHEDGECSDEDFDEVYGKCQRYFEAQRAEYAAARK